MWPISMLSSSLEITLESDDEDDEEVFTCEAGLRSPSRWPLVISVVKFAN